MDILARYRKELCIDGCPNCGSVVRTADAYPHMRRPAELWDSWRCANPDCPESLEWHDIFEDINYP